MKRILLLTTPLALFLLPLMAGTPSYQGTWSAPSLSQPATPIIITLSADGQATEQVGAYHGKGTWKTTSSGAEITWASGWTGLLRPAAQDKFELLTWKPESSPNSPPADTQPARRITPDK